MEASPKETSTDIVVQKDEITVFDFWFENWKPMQWHDAYIYIHLIGFQTDLKFKNLKPTIGNLGDLYIPTLFYQNCWPLHLPLHKVGGWSSSSKSPYLNIFSG